MIKGRFTKTAGIGIMLVLVFVISLGSLAGCGKKDVRDDSDVQKTSSTASLKTEETAVDEDGVYDSKENVTAYILAFGRLPSNYITKCEARKLGWSGGSVEPYAPGKCIGGDRFGNYEGQLPKGEYIECDIDTLDHKDRGSRRLIFSDKEIYYTHDHYRHFEKVCDI